jgi:uncharacterized protein (TIGR02145 family)
VKSVSCYPLYKAGEYLTKIWISIPEDLELESGIYQMRLIFKNPVGTQTVEYYFGRIKKGLCPPSAQTETSNTGKQVRMVDQQIRIVEQQSGTMKDIDGNVYQTIKIGYQEWTAENLRTTKYNDGTPIPYNTGERREASDSASRKSADTNSPAYCYHNSTTDPKHIKKYGALYNWHVVNTGKLAPPGWHVPTDAEWTELEDYLITNGYNWDGTTWGNKIAKSLASKTDWDSSSHEGAIGNDPGKNNASGFSALPGGHSYPWGCDGDPIGSWGSWWSASEIDADFAWSRDLWVSDSLRSNRDDKDEGHSVRLLRD